MTIAELVLTAVLSALVSLTVVVAGIGLFILGQVFHILPDVPLNSTALLIVLGSVFTAAFILLIRKFK